MHKFAFLSALLATGTLAATPAASRDAGRLCSGQEPYPAQSAFHVPFPRQPRAATRADGLTPKIEQVRHGVVIATYKSFASNPATCKFTWPSATAPMNLTAYAASGCGPFGGVAHVDLFNVTEPGDVFRVYPAVYSGPENSFLIQPRPDYYQGPPQPAANITIQGVTVAGIRPILQDVPNVGMWYSNQAPVYIGTSSDIKIDNLDMSAAGIPPGGQRMAAIYVNGAHNFTLSNSRLTDFQRANGNGIFGTSNNTGTLALENVEIARNGGAISSLTHQIYISASSTDPGFTFRVRGLYSHDAHIGHLLKSRAQNTDIQDSWFIGGAPQPGHRRAETYAVDVPNGGTLVFKNNVVVKDASGDGTNGALLTFGVEGLNAEHASDRAQTADIEGNIFIAFAKTYDGVHPIWPMFFYGHGTPGALPGYTVPRLTGGAITPRITATDNTFIGFCDPATNAMSYRGDHAAVAGFADLNADYTLKSASRRPAPAK